MTRPSSSHRAPLNEDVFAPPASGPALSLEPAIQELSEHIHQLLLQVRAEERRLGRGGRGGLYGYRHLTCSSLYLSLCTAPVPWGSVESALGLPQALSSALARLVTATGVMPRGLGLLPR